TYITYFLLPHIHSNTGVGNADPFIVNLLLEHGANVAALSKRGSSPLLFDLYRKKMRIAKIFQAAYISRFGGEVSMTLTKAERASVKEDIATIECELQKLFTIMDDVTDVQMQLNFDPKTPTLAATQPTSQSNLDQKNIS